MLSRVLNFRLFKHFFSGKQKIVTLKKEYGCQQYIRVIRVILYGVETDTSSTDTRFELYRST